MTKYINIDAPQLHLRRDNRGSKVISLIEKRLK